MRSSSFIHKPVGRIAQSCAAVVLVIAGLSIAAPCAARAQDAAAHPVDRLLKALDLKTDPGQPADFVTASRPKEERDFLAVGEPHPTRPVKVKTADELKAMEADLDAARVRHDKLSGRKAVAPKPVKKTGAAPTSAAAASTQN